MKSQLQNLAAGNVNLTNLNTAFNSIIPIYICLKYGKKFLKFPVNPESLKIQNDSSSKSVNISGYGEVAIPQRTRLKTLTIESFFWGGNPNAIALPSEQYVQWLEEWQRSMKPATLIVTRLGYSMEVICDDFTHWINAGEEENVYFSLQLKEYRAYGARRLSQVGSETILQQIQRATRAAVSPILFELPRPTRITSNKPAYTSPYVTKENDTLCGITKKITGGTDGWNDLYALNKKVLHSPDDIPVGTRLQLPDGWTGGGVKIAG